MKKTLLVFCTGLLLLSCSDEHAEHNDKPEDHPKDKQTETETNSRKKQTLETEKVTGKELYMQNCAGCHGEDRAGNPPDIPALQAIHEKRSRSFVRDLMKTGKGIMPSFSYLTTNKQKAIVDYLMNTSSEPVKQEPVTLADRGKRLFAANCARCHQATTNDPEPTGMPSKHPMNPAPMAGVTKRFSLERFDRILNRGPGMMPSFSYLSRSSRDTLWAYFKTLEGKGEPEGPTKLERHPGMMRDRHPDRHPRRGRSGNESQPGFSINDISRAIHRHIENRMEQNDGYLSVRDRKTEETVKLTELVHVHEDRLSRVQPDRYFACVDLKTEDGTLYDIDFFLEPSGNQLQVTETMVHKVDGKLHFQWMQDDGFWKREEIK